MSDEEDIEELPMIYFNSSASNASTFSMPSAEALAVQRAREQECERELRLLGQHAPDLRTDSSSGSEAEAALAAAVTDLSVAPPPAARGLRLADLLAALVCALPPAARAPLELLARPGAARRLPGLVAGAAALLAADELVWADDDVLATGALLAGAALAHDAGGRAAALRALHALLDQRAAERQARALGAALLRALPHVAARRDLCDALRSGAGAGADRLAAELLDATLLDLLEPEGAEADAEVEARLLRALDAGWRSLAPAESYCGVQLVGRRLGAGAARSGGALLAALAAPLAPAHRSLHPDRLKVSVGLRKLRLLFHSEK